MFEYNVPVVRATWFIRVVCLNEQRAKLAQVSLIKLWTEELEKNLNSLLDKIMPLPKKQADPRSSPPDASLMRQWSYLQRLMDHHFDEGLLQRVCAPMFSFVKRVL